MFVLLADWDAIELFSRMVSTFESRDISDFYNNHVIINSLEKYKKKENYLKVSFRIFGGQNETFPNKPKSIYDFVRLLSHSLPVTLPKDVFDHICEFIGDKQFAAKRIRTSANIHLSNKQRKMEGSKWWIYFLDERSQIINNKSVQHIGISKGVLELENFGKAIFTRLKHNDKETRVYTGLFRTFRNEEYIGIKMKMEPGQERDLRIMFYIGSDNTISLAVGLATNLSSSDYTKAIMIEPITGRKNPLKEIGFSYLEKGSFQVPDHVKLFFSSSTNKISKVPKTITSVEKFYSWYTKE